MFLRHKAIPKAAVCCADTVSGRAAADRLDRLGLCRWVPLPAEDPKTTLTACLEERPRLVILEAMPDAMEKLDDPDKDIAGRCELSALIKEGLPDCRVFLWCGEAFRSLSPITDKAVQAGLIDGCRFGSLTKELIARWLADERPHKI